MQYFSQPFCSYFPYIITQLSRDTKNGMGSLPLYTYMYVGFVIFRGLMNNLEFQYFFIYFFFGGGGGGGGSDK